MTTSQSTSDWHLDIQLGVGFKGTQGHAWDVRKPFQAACEGAGIKNLRIHDLRHTATSILFMDGIPEAIIKKLTGHRSRELERYEHRSPVIKRQTVELIAKNSVTQCLAQGIRRMKRKARN